MPPLDQPLKIGAQDLLSLCDATHIGDIYVLCKSWIGKKWTWKQKYVIISRGCLYVYVSRKATKPDQSYSLKHFQCATESDPENGEKICFRLSYTTAKAPILFSCDTTENRTKWIQQFQAAISEVKEGQYYSADSGFGSAGMTVDRSEQKTPEGSKYDEVNENFLGIGKEINEDTMATRLPVHSCGTPEESKYDEVNENFLGIGKEINDDTMAPHLPVQPCEDDGGYENPIGVLVSDAPLYENKLPDGDNYQRNDHKTTGPSGTSERDTHAPPSDNLINELKNHLEDRGQLSQAEAKPLPLLKPSVNKSPAISHVAMSSLKIPSSSLSSNRQETNASELSSLDRALSSFCSVRSRTTDSVRSSDFQENHYQNDESDGSADNTSTKVLYENPEPLQSMLTNKFAREDYFCLDKLMGKRSLKKQKVGHFAVFPLGDMTEYELCIQTPKGLKYYRVYSQNGRVSLYKLHEAYTFSSLDKLLSYYSMHDLPSREYQVKLQYGCYSKLS